jgi:hypothetical protein
VSPKLMNNLEVFKYFAQVCAKLLGSSWKFFITCTIITSSIIFSPSIRRLVGMESLFTEYRPAFTLTWLFCMVYVAVSVLAALKQRLFAYFSLRKEARRKAEIADQKEYEMLSILNLMPQEEREVLSLFEEEDSTIWLPSEECCVVGLVSKGVLRRTPTTRQYRGPIGDKKICGQYRVAARFRELVFGMPRSR